MAAWRRAIELSLGDADSAKLRSLAISTAEGRWQPRVQGLAKGDQTHEKPI